ncbi:MAG: SCO family protein [Gemmatimonadaceae bacterium]
MPLKRSYPGAAGVALGFIAIVTVGWWMLALYPAGTTPPGWLVRTRLACFGASPSGLPNAGGWVLLIGEPIGMVGALLVVWGRDVREDMRRWLSTMPGRAIIGLACGALLWGGAAAARVVWQARQTAGSASFDISQAPASVVTIPAVPPLALIDQGLRPFDLSELERTPVLVTFAFGHCETVCPAVVHQVMALREVAGRADVPLVVVTVDPWRDVPTRLSAIVREWGLASGDRVLSGEPAVVNAALDAWGVGRARDERTGDISHAVVVVLVDRAHRNATRVTGDVMQLSARLRTA